MKHPILRIVFIAIFTLVPFTAPVAEGGEPYLYQQLRKPALGLRVVEHA